MESIPFVHLHVLLLRTPHRERQEEYCVTLRLNAEHDLVDSIHLVTDSDSSAASTFLAHTCGLSASQLSKVSVAASPVLDYATLFRAANAIASPTTLQVVLNGDVVLGHWRRAMELRGCLPRMHARRLAFGLSRREPSECFPLLNGLHRTQHHFRAVDWNTYHDICSNSYLAQRSRDGLAFNAPLEEPALASLSISPNRLGAESLVSCRLQRLGNMTLSNPCFDLPLLHNHCSDQRNYSHWRVDALESNGTCQTHRVQRNSLHSICDFPLVPESANNSAARSRNNSTYRLPKATRLQLKRWIQAKDCTTTNRGCRKGAVRSDGSDGDGDLGEGRRLSGSMADVVGGGTSSQAPLRVASY